MEINDCCCDQLSKIEAEGVPFKLLSNCEEFESLEVHKKLHICVLIVMLNHLICRDHLLE